MAVNNCNNATLTLSTFTPVISFGGASVGITYDVQSGSYIQVGNIVFYNLTIGLTNKGSSTGSFLISGMPSNASVAQTTVIRVSDMSYAAGNLQPRLLTNGTIQVENIVSASPPVQLTNAELTNTSGVVISGWYSV